MSPVGTPVIQLSARPERELAQRWPSCRSSKYLYEVGVCSTTKIEIRGSDDHENLATSTLSPIPSFPQ